MQSSQSARPPVGVIFDSAMGSRIDEVLALALLFGLAGRGEARVISLSTSKANLKSAALNETLARFFSGAPDRPLFRMLPIGYNESGLMPEDTPILDAVLSKKAEAGGPAHHHSIQHINDTSLVDALIRNACTAQHDQNAVVVLAGPAVNLAKVLALPGAKDIIALKVRNLVMTLGTYPRGGPEYNAEADVEAARRVLADWPTPIVAAGAEIGEALQFPAASIEKDFAWAPHHPVVDAYRAYKAMPYDAPASALAAALYAVRPESNLFKLSEPGKITISGDGSTRFAPDSSTKHRFLTPEIAQKEQLLATLVELVSAKPVPPRPRMPGAGD